MTSKSSNPTNYLKLSGVYTCPVCRYGKIAALPLMDDAFGCEFCHHIFTANLETQVLKMADSQLPLAWHWNGKTWQGAHRKGVELGWGYGIAGIAFVVLPPTLIGVAAYLFPPVPGDPLSWLPVFWTMLAFLLHLSCLGWLMVEYYQFPVFAYLRAMGQRLVSR
ncbi:MAG: hypothetical protein BRC40_06140 [Cyanobacteria bacterium QH_8_48_120]|jgi:hypothetical protein|nr:MAG: hypothetical protein BRC34_04655 [Cyanobacteria bacterium QH_1_48_107]PSO57674.1 MAG: hypothetical protein BRC35_07150 [Cyanobacteria bacterium QH_10_48_56]PSO62984.1 MAG: hypothetical protein BRC39_05285 [Cyanobacteria bacterium QH_7_48_89]PSO65134.1 MAG: hypothetical protein BRC36_04355 [Cyanobacteria bacterium QH_2_48_84]PSO67552.1 MAG: hypothetical protein BRC38_03025 [Cyanobacteria bacterium QH_6_48_35]PSO69613.1 MAG: hypothetical protein BRC37_17225 [Cyanobacteria bacterium QH_3_